MALRGTLKSFRDRVAAAPVGEQIAYHTSRIARRPRGVFEFFREESDAGRVFLFQRIAHSGGRDITFYCAQKISKVAARFVARVGKL